MMGEVDSEKKAGVGDREQDGCTGPGSNLEQGVVTTIGPYSNLQSRSKCLAPQKYLDSTEFTTLNA